MKKFISVSSLILSLAIALPVLAQTPPPAAPVPTTASKIACVGAAVATREAAIGVAIGVHAGAVEAAYKVRATELAGAYSNQTAKAVQVGVKTSWADFTKSVKAAQKTWSASRSSAWSTFRTAAAACKPPYGVSDSANSSAEVSGQ